LIFDTKLGTVAVMEIELGKVAVKVPLAAMLVDALKTKLSGTRRTGII
jgi:hypothetical protein